MPAAKCAWAHGQVRGECRHRVVSALSLAAVLVGPVGGCYLHGTDSGECVTLSSDLRDIFMPFCGPVVRYSACFPKTPDVSGDRNHPQGRWNNHTILRKDQWVQETVKRMISYRVGLERNASLQNAGKNEYGESMEIRPRFHKNPDCRQSYKNYFCWINFPRCDGQDESLMTCRSACENFFKACNYEQDLWRCGPSKYFNGYEPEAAKPYLRDFFPGQPFRELDPNRAVCTPSIEGAAPRVPPPLALMAICATFAIFLPRWW